MSRGILRSCTSLKEPQRAVSFLAGELVPENSELSILFVSPSYQFESLAPQIQKHFKGNVLACTTAGEISSGGYSENSIVGISFPSESFEATVVDLDDIRNLNEDLVKLKKEEISGFFDSNKGEAEAANCFAILLVDGLLMKEESVTNVLSYIIPSTVPLIGGSAGDGLSFNQTIVYSSSGYGAGRASVALVKTSKSFEPFKFQHFEETETKMVITEANPDQRLVLEIDGMPAAEAYANHLQIPVSDFGPDVYSRHPLMMKIAGDNFVRSIQKVNSDNSLTFYCAIEEGCVLTLANRKSILDNVAELYNYLENRLGEIDSCLLFECILRRLEVSSQDPVNYERIMEHHRNNKSVGFHTYGEQYGGVHINQTITGIAFGK